MKHFMQKIKTLMNELQHPPHPDYPYISFVNGRFIILSDEDHRL